MPQSRSRVSSRHRCPSSSGSQIRRDYQTGLVLNQAQHSCLPARWLASILRPLASNPHWHWFQTRTGIIFHRPHREGRGRPGWRHQVRCLQHEHCKERFRLHQRDRSPPSKCSACYSIHWTHDRQHPPSFTFPVGPRPPSTHQPTTPAPPVHHCLFLTPRMPMSAYLGPRRKPTTPQRTPCPPFPTCIVTNSTSYPVVMFSRPHAPPP